MIQVKCDVQTRKAIPNSNLLGFETDNESNSIYFRVNPHISGTAEVYIERDQDTGYIVLDEASDSYYLPIKKSLVKQKGTVIMQLIITTSDEKVYTFDKITFEVKTSIKVDEEIPDEYPTWMEVGNARLAEFNEAIEETNVAIQEINEAIDDANQAIDDMNEVKDQILEDKEAGLFDGFSPIATVTETDTGATISITDVNGTTTADVLNGEKGDKGDTGASAKINGVNTLNIEAGENVTLNQEDSTLTISATDTTDYTELTNKPSINNIELSGNKSLSDLGIKQEYTKSDVGLGNVDNVRQYSASNPPPYPVTSVNGNTGAVVIDTHDDLIPTQASSSNQLADKNFVNSTVGTATATFRGTYNSLAELEQVTADENDYGFVVSTDSAGNTVYNRYKYASGTWVFEYALNNSSFTAAQWEAIQSGITDDLVTKLQGIEDNAEVNIVEGLKIGNVTQQVSNKIMQINPDTTPTQGSTNVIDSNAVYEVEKLLPTDSANGESVDIDNAQPYKVLNVVADGKYEQDTTQGYNILPVTATTRTLNGLTFTVNADNSLTINGTATANMSFSIYNDENGINLNGDYVYYLIGKNNKINLQGDLNGSTVAFIPFSSTSEYVAKTYTNSVLTRVFSYISNGTTFNNETFKYMLIQGTDTTKPYEPYTGGIPSPNPNYPQTITQITSATWNRANEDNTEIQTIPIDLDGNEVCATDTVKDKLLVDRYGNVAIQKNVGKRILNGSESWTATQTANVFWTTDNDYLGGTNAVISISDRYIGHACISQASTITGNYSTTFNKDKPNYPRLYIKDIDCADTTALQTKLASKNTTVYYALATPTIIPLPKLSILPSTLKGINHIWLDTNLGRTAIEVEYVKDLSLDIPTKTSELTNDANFVKNTDYANTTTGGVIVVSSAHGTSMSNDGKLRGVTKTYAQYQSADNLLIVSKITLENVLTERIGTIETALTTLDIGGGVA